MIAQAKDGEPIVRRLFFLSKKDADPAAKRSAPNWPDGARPGYAATNDCTRTAERQGPLAEARETRRTRDTHGGARIRRTRETPA